MEISQNAVNILACKNYKGIGTAWIANNIKGNESTDKLVNLLENSISKDFQVSLEGFQRIQDKIRHDLSRVSSYLDGIVALGDKDFPIPRGDIKKAEQISVLFYKGDIRLLNKKNFNIATIGLLKPTQEIERRERAVVAELVAQGASIVSGLALGCDTIAHEECLRSQGKTVAILPSTLNKIMPAKNQKLANEIVEKGGLLLSEYYADFSSQREMISRYIERDRLQALFSDGIVLSASYTKNNLGNDSGSRHAMQYAKNYGIPRAVIYDETQDCNDPQYALNKQILAEGCQVHILDSQNKKSINAFVSKLQEKRKPTVVHGSFFD